MEGRPNKQAFAWRLLSGGLYVSYRNGDRTNGAHYHVDHNMVSTYIQRSFKKSKAKRHTSLGPRELASFCLAPQRALFLQQGEGLLSQQAPQILKRYTWFIVNALKTRKE